MPMSTGRPTEKADKPQEVKTETVNTAEISGLVKITDGAVTRYVKSGEVKRFEGYGYRPV